MIWIKKSNDNRRRMLKLSLIKEYPEMRYPLKWEIEIKISINQRK
jgi:hypothetical protein